MVSARSQVVPGAGRLTGVDWRRLGCRCMVGALAAMAVVQIVHQAQGSEYGYDFRGGTWDAGRALLSGRSPFPEPYPAWLLKHSNGFITPPVLAVVGAPFSLLPFGTAIVAFNLVCVACLLAALRLLDVRSPAFYIVVLCSFPFVASLGLGQPDGMFALGAALAWRYREAWPGAVAAGAIIAAKLLAWPLIVWLLVTRRYRQAAVAAGCAAAMLAASWACIGFKGLAAYPRLLSADARAFGTDAHSILTALVRTGVPEHTAMVLTVALAAAVGAAVVLTAAGSDLGWFTAALTFGILASPIVWQHYFLLLFIPLAATRRTGDPLVWLLTLALWISPSETPATLAQAWLIPVLASAIALRIAVLSRPVAATRSGEPQRRARGDDHLGTVAAGRVQERRETILEPALQVPRVSLAGDQSALRQASQRVADRRPFGADEVPEHLVGQRNR